MTRPNGGANGVRDAGLTLVELLVTLALLGLIATVIGSAVTVVFRNQDGISDVVSESHDVQQAVNYFSLDIESGSALVIDYRDQFSGVRGTGCSDAGNANVLQFESDPDGDTTDGDLTDDHRIAYRLTTTGGLGRLDRYVCSWNGSTWVESSVLNIADRLDAGGGPAATATVIPATDASLVDRVELSLAQSGRSRKVAASPRAETGNFGPFGVGLCAGNPLAGALGFGSFVEDDMQLDDGDIEGSLAVGGSFGWRGNGRDVGSDDVNNTNGFSNVTLYASTVDWGYSSTAGPLEASTNASERVMLGGTYNVVGGDPNRIYQSGSSGPRIEIDKNAFADNVSARPVDFTAQFGELRNCAEALANLPNGATASHATLNYPSSTRMNLTWSSSGAHVFNVPENYLSGITQLTVGSAVSNSQPLIVNVSEIAGDGDDDIDFDVSVSSLASGQNYKFALFNFTNVEGTVTIRQSIYGTIYAPFATVVTEGRVRGAVIAKNWIHDGNDVENDTNTLFNGTINWTP